MKKSQKIKFLLIIVSFIMSVTAVAQNKATLHGKVTSAVDKESLIGVSVAEKDKNNRILNVAITDIDGNYTLKLSGNPETTITFSYIGYKPTTKNAVKTSEVLSALFGGGELEVPIIPPIF